MTLMTQHRLSEIGDAAGCFRPFLETCWRRWKAESAKGTCPLEADSAGMCGFTSAFLAEALARTVGGEWRVAGGRPFSGGGVTCPQGRLNGHFWCVSDDGVIVDLTADQFGLPTVLVTTLKDSRYSETFTAEEIDEHLPKVLPVAEAWLEAALDEGLLPGGVRLAA